MIKARTSRSTWRELAGADSASDADTDGADRSEQNLARQAELALERQGEHDSLFYEGRRHSAGSLAGVVGRPDVRLGEEVAAFVSLRPDAAAAVEELSDPARKHPGANGHPRQITIVPAIPLTSVGKLVRKKLRRWVPDAASVQAGS